jgi:hypothetical protein
MHPIVIPPVLMAAAHVGALVIAVALIGATVLVVLESRDHPLAASLRRYLRALGS